MSSAQPTCAWCVPHAIHMAQRCRPHRGPHHRCYCCRHRCCSLMACQADRTWNTCSNFLTKSLRRSVEIKSAVEPHQNSSQSTPFNFALGRFEINTGKENRPCFVVDFLPTHVIGVGASKHSFLFGFTMLCNPHGAHGHGGYRHGAGAGV